MTSPDAETATSSAQNGASPTDTRRRPLVVMDQVTKMFSSGTVALSDMSLTVNGGEFVSLLGPSGCGKSTALRIIAGLGDVSTGTIDWPSSRINSRGLPEGDISFVFQEPTLMPWQTVFGNVHLPLKLKGISKAAAREEIMATLATVGLKDFADAYPRELSGGMKMRVSIARALVTRPALLLMDEPFAALDEITRQKLNDDLQALKARLGTTVVFVTHSVYESVYLSTRIAVMAARPGRVLREVAVPAALPRGQAFRLSPAYAALCAETSEALQAAIATAGDETR